MQIAVREPIGHRLRDGALADRIRVSVLTDQIGLPPLCQALPQCGQRGNMLDFSSSHGRSRPLPHLLLHLDQSREMLAAISSLEQALEHQFLRRDEQDQEVGAGRFDALAHLTNRRHRESMSFADPHVGRIQRNVAVARDEDRPEARGLIHLP